MISASSNYTIDEVEVRIQLSTSKRQVYSMKNCGGSASFRLFVIQNVCETKA